MQLPGRLRNFAAAVLCLIGQSLYAQNVFLIPTDTTSTNIATLTANPLQWVTNVSGAPGVIRIIGSASPTKHYALTNTPDTVLVLEGAFPRPTVTKRLNLAGTATTGTLSGDGRRLIVVGPTGVGVVDTATDTSLSLMVGNFDVGSDPIDVAASLDGRRAFVLSRASSRLTALDLTGAGTVVGSLALPARPEAVTVSPSGLVYVSAQNSIYEVDPTALSIRASIFVNGTAGKLQFTPNGLTAVAAAPAASGRGAFLIDLVRRNVKDLSIAGLALRELVLVSNTTAYAINTDGHLYRVDLGTDATITATRIQGESVPPGITGLAVTGEVPQSRYVLIAVPTGIYRLDTTSGAVGESIAPPFAGRLEVVRQAQTGTAARVLAYSTAFTAPAGTTTQPLVLRAIDANGLPVSNVQVTFAGPSGVTIGSPTVTTNAEGYASTVVALPANATSAITVTGTVAGQAPVQFTITPGDPRLPGVGSNLTRTGLQIVAGQGQAVPQFFSTSGQEPMRVRLTDAQGNPIPDAQITWQIVQGAGSLVVVNNGRTSSDGESTANLTGPFINPGTSSVLTIISATAPDGQRRDFLITTVAGTMQRQGSIDVQWELPAGVLEVRAGETLPDAIRAIVTVTGTVERLPNIGMRIVNPTGSDPASTPYVECRNVYAMSDREGRVSCDLVAGARTSPPDITVTAMVGSVHQRTFTVRVLQGNPANIRVLQGGGQSGNAGQALTPIVVEVTDAGGNVLPNVPVEWQIPNFFPAATSIQRTTDINGRAAATLVLPTNQSGTFTIRAVAGNATATFNVTVNAVAGAIAATQGNNQPAALINTPFGQALQVRVTNAQGQALPGASVTFAVTSGSATVNPATVTTGADGTASTNVTAGNTAGPVVITATSGTASATFNLTVRLAGPVFTANDILNAAGFSPGVSPGSIAYIRASGIAPNLRGSTTANNVVGPLPLRLADVEVLFNNVPAPVYAVSNIRNEESVIVQVPYEVAPGRADVTIRTSGGGVTTLSGVEILPVKPGVFTFTDTNNTTYAVATRPDGSYINSTNPARRGEQIRVYATGLGQTSPGTGTNRTGVAGQAVSASLIGGINNAGTRVVSAELLPGSIGVYVVTLEIPADTATGQNQPIGLGVVGTGGNGVFANSTFIPIV
ncbi:MAG TPA: Ig-like domain-containing protein [Bryobacteraceae bacterium]|nr:Ig-like domain-containing protein [Bryobacteraceae bacterium]